MRQTMSKKKKKTKRIGVNKDGKNFEYAEHQHKMKAYSQSFADADYKDKLSDKDKEWYEKFEQGYYNNQYKSAEEIGLDTKITNQNNNLAKEDLMSYKPFDLVPYDPNKDNREDVEIKEEYKLPICEHCFEEVDSAKVIRNHNRKAYEMIYKCHGQSTVLHLCNFSDLTGPNPIKKEDLLKKLPKTIQFLGWGSRWKKRSNLICFLIGCYTAYLVNF